ncbi:MAG: AMP-binding protein [Actinobacteria bacterium]|nr:AMP-binding protein [Actinomycetota bacterium]
MTTFLDTERIVRIKVQLMEELKLLDFIIQNLTSSNNSGSRFFSYKDKYRVWKYTFGQIFILSCKFAKFLSDKGLVKVDKVLIKGKNKPEWVAAFIGCLMNGCVVVPLDLKSSPEFDLKVYSKVKARAVVTEDIETSRHFEDINIIKIFFDQFEELFFNSSVYSSSETAFFTSNADAGSGSSADVNHFKRSPNFIDFYLKNINAGVNSDDLAEIVFTSGTTTEPKGVMITYGNIEANLKAIIPVMQKYGRIFKVMINPKILSLVPLSHMYGQLIGIFTPLMVSSSVMFASNLSPQYLLKVIKEEKIWILGLLPKLLEMLKEYITAKFELNTEKFRNFYLKMKFKRWQLRLIAFMGLHYRIGWRLVALMVGGAVLNPAVDEFFRCLAYSIFQGYGLTETSPLITLSDPVGSVAGSIGKLLPGQEIKIVNNEVYVRGANVSRGYYEDSLKTEKAFEGGWFKTGDIAEVDEEGNVFFKGRKDDVIVRSDGLNIFPEDIETVIKSVGSVKDCAVVGMKTEKDFEIIAVLILKEGARKTPRQIVMEANSRLNLYQKVDNFLIWEEDDFPRTPTMKVKKSILADFIREKLSSGEIADKLFMPEEKRELQQKKSSGVYGIISSFHKIGRKPVSRSSKLESDVGLDSLELIELSAAIEEKYNIEVDDAAITKDTTIEELEKMISSPPKESKRIPFYSFPYWLAVRIIRAAFQYFLYPFISMLYILKVYGRENLKGLKGPVVFAANHISNLDTFVVLYSMPLKVRYRVTALMSIEHHFQNFFYRKGLLIRRVIEAIGFYLLVNLAVNACPLSRTHGFKQVLENVGKLIDRGWSVLIFPEGGVTLDGSIRKFESGIGIIALDMKVPVVPVKIEGLYNILRNGILPWGHMPKWPRVKITFGKPVIFKNKSYMEVAEELEDIIRNRL